MKGERLGVLALLALGALTGLYGLDWGLPGRHRLRAFPEGLRMTPETAKRFADEWARLYESIERAHGTIGQEEPITYVQDVETVAPGWSFPPPNLLNSYRSLLLQSENPDEKKSFIILGRMRPWRLGFEPLYVFYGGAYIYPLGAFLAAASLTGAVALVPSMEHYLMRPDDMGALYLAGRLFIVLFHLGALWLLYDIGRKVTSARAGLWGAALYALAPVVAVNTHLLKPHPYAAFWILAALRQALLARRSGAGRDYLLMGAFCGMALGSSFTYGLFCVIPALVWLERRLSGAATRAETGRAAACLAAAAAVFAITNPYFAASPLRYAWDLTYYAPEGGSWTLSSLVSLLGEGWAGAVGPVAYACTGAGFLAALRRGGETRRLAWMLAALFALLWLLFGRFYAFGLSGGGIRYYYPLIGLGCVLAGDFLARLSERRPALAGALLAAALLDGGLRSGVYLENMRRGAGAASTRRQAADWIEANVPAGSTIGLTRYPEPAHTPPFRYDRYTLVIFDRPERLDAAGLPGHVVAAEENRRPFEEWAGGRYRLAGSFLPVNLGWARPTDPQFYANAGIFVYERKGPAAAQ